jgi:RHS repeat-associated protein
VSCHTAEKTPFKPTLPGGKRNFSALAVLVLLLPFVFWLSSSVTANAVNVIDGTAGDDFIIVGVSGARVTPGAGDDFLVGGPGDNRYVISSDGGKDTLYEIEGSNYVEFDSSIGYGDVSSGLMKSGNDLILNIGQNGQSLTIKSFFTVNGTIQEFQFSTGETLPASLLFQVFGLTAPTTTKTSKVPYLGEAGVPLLTGSEVGDILIPIEDTETLQGQAGDDFLVGRANGVTFEIGLGNGEDFIIAYEGQNVVLFVDGISFNDVASNLMKSGDDLILSNGDAGNEVRIYKFFTRANTVSAIRFESGGEISAEQVINLFGVPEPAQAPPFQMIVDGTPLGGGGSDPDNGSGGDLPLCSEPGVDPANCDDGSGENPPPDEPCDPATQNCGGTGGSDPGNEWPELLRLTGTGYADLLVVSAEATLVTGGAGDDFLIGGPADDRYWIDAGEGRDTIHDVEGQNVIEFLSGISYSDVASGLMKAGDDLVLNIGQNGQSLTIKRFFSIDNTISALEFQDGSQLASTQLFQVFGITPPTAVVQSLQLNAGKADGSPLVGSAGPDILIPRMGAKVLQGLGGDDYLIGRIGYGGGINGYFGNSAVEGVTFEINPDSGKKFIIAYEGRNLLYYTAVTNYSDVTFSRIADDLVLGNSQNDSEVRVYQFFARQNTINAIQFASGEEIDRYQLFDMFSVEPPATSGAALNMVVAGASFDSCSPNPRLDGAEGYGLTPGQLGETNQPPTIISTPDVEAWALSAYEYMVRAADANNDELCFSLTVAPEAMKIDVTSGLIWWEPDRSQFGVHPVEITVSDERGAVTTQSFDVEVKDPNRPPVLVNTALHTAVAGQPYHYEVWVSDPDGGTPSLEIVDGPAGMAIAGNIVTWTPTVNQLGAHSVSLRATDMYGAASVQTFQLDVTPLTVIEDIPEGMSRIPMTGARVSVHELDDAATQVGTPRLFERNDELGIVTDKVNGLVWEDTAHVTQKYEYLSNAASYCSNLELGGIDSWRLPTRLELVFLVEHHRRTDRDSLINPSFQHTDREFFAIDYSESGRLTHFNSFIDFAEGILKPESSLGANVRCVSGVKRFEPEFYKPPGQDIAVDRTNRLMWQDDLQTLDNDAVWSGALEFCGTLDLAGHSDWRLPNYNESQLLMQEFDHHVSADHPSQIFQYVPATRHWNTSTGTAYYTDAYTPVNLSSNWNFEYQSEIPTGLVINHIHQSKVDQAWNYPFRCVRSYAEPVAHIESFPDTVNFDELVTLDASGSYDTDGTIMSHQWYSLTDDVELGTSPILHLNSLTPGQHHIRLTVTDNNGLSQDYPHPIVITVIPPPEIVITGETLVRLGQDVVLDASGSVSNSGIVAYRWIDQATGGVVGNQAVLVLGGLSTGTWAYILEVTDANGQVMTTAFDVTINEVPPVVVVDESYTIVEGGSVNLDGSGSYDTDGQVVAYRWFDGDSGQLLGEGPTLQLSGVLVGTKTYQLEVEDDSGLSDQKLVTVNVGYQPEAIAPDVVSGYINTQIHLDGSGSTVTEGSLTYQWYINGELVSETASNPVEYPETGTYTVELVVTTELGLSDSKIITIEVLGTRELAQCTANPVTDDRGYEKLYPENDAEWLGNDAATVEDIERAFNFARAQDPSVFQYLIMPSQALWDAMTVQEKGLYLVNAERTARGIKPYEGVAPEVATVAQEYADYILTRNQVIGHYNDGLSPGDRLDVNAYIAGHRDAHVRNESVASGSGYGEQATVDRALAKAIFGWIYQDKAWFEDFDWATGPAWGHRDHVLQTGLNENSGIPTAEGLIAFGVSRGPYLPGQASPETYGYVTVFHTIDQNDQWNLATVSTADTSAAQGCNTAHILDIDESLIETNGLSEIRVSPSTLMMVPGNSLPLQVMGVYDNGNQSDFTPYASFVADSRSIISVSDGMVTAEQTGQAQVFARINGLESNRLFVRVREATDISNIQGTAAEAYSEYVPDNASVTGYDPMAMAVYTGVVQDRNGQSLEGVQASFLNRPELGSTKTDSNGRFIVAGPAGQQTIVYEKPGRLVVQRTTIGASNTWSNLEDVMLLLRDSKQTLIDLNSSEPQIHQSTPVIDEFGKRQATIVFNGITSATVLSAEGSTRNLDSFLLSATEFETPASMPGELPSEVAFTFANELHAAGVHYNDTVVFDNDVVMFIDNFLGFDVGEIVPIGYFDHLDNQWAASSNGVVVQLLDTNGDGIVDGLDYTGDSLPDDLNGRGNTQDDVLGLEGYKAGDTLWWGSFNHFTSYDYNWGSSEDEAPTDLDLDLSQEDESNEESECTGSYVKPYQQTFHEDISIAGTNLTLHYSSQRTEGYKHKARIKVSGATIPSTLEQMIVKLEVAGRVFQRELTPAINTEVEFIWDGTRIDGVRPEGMVSGRVSIGYEYKAQYISAGNAAEQNMALADFPVAWAQVGDSVTAVPGRQNYTSWQTRGVSFKNSFDRQLGSGWSLSNVHEFDPAGRVYLGNGSVVDVETQSLILKTGLTYSLLEGDDGYYQSGGSTIDYTVNDEGVLVDKVTGLEWQYTDRPFEARTKAEAKAYCATAATPENSGWRLPTSKEVGYTIEKSGANIGPAIYSLTRAQNLWRQSSANPDEELKPVMCVRGESIDERYVQGLQRDVTQQVVVDKDNGLMWQDAPENALTKRDWAASIQHCEATTFAGFDDWRLPNINELLYVLPNDVFQHQSVMTIPSGEYWSYQASFRQPYWSSTTNYQEDTQAWAIESLSFNSARFSKSDQYYARCVRDAASSARMPYRFDKDGKHIATIDLDSGKTLVEFSYNDSDKLVGMTDQFGNHIAIERDINGTPTRIVAADGQVTELTVNEQNNLTALAYEDASQYQFFYQAGGLLTEKVDPNGYSYPHEFDENGRVYQTRDPEGGQWDFFDTRVGIGHDKYGYTTAEGEHYQTVRRVLENGDVRKEITYKNGATLIDILRADQLQQTTTYGGVTTVVDKVLDSKTLQEIPSVITITQPSGLASVTSLNETYGQNGADTTRYTLTTDVNGDISTTEVDARAGTLTQTSAEGRVVSEVVDPDTLLTQSVSVAGLQDTVFAYDTRGRLTGQAVGTRSTTYHYGSEGRGQVTAITTADGQQTLYEYDSLGRVTKVTYPDGHASLSEYDENGNRTTLVVPTPADHNSAYNGINRVTSETTPLGEATLYEYDRDRRLTAIELPSGQRLENTYTQNRLTQTNTPEGSILYSYHHGDQLSQISEGTETLSYTWDGSLLKEIGYQGELNEGIQYDHNVNFQISQLTYAGDSTNLSYDRDGLLTGIHGFTIGRHANHGLPISLDNGTLNRTFAYNGYGEVTHVSTELNQAAAFDYELTYNSVGQITGKTETLPNGTVNQYSYTYDDRYRLTGVTKNSLLVEQYQYDANGNRTLATSIERGVSGVSASYNLGDQLQSFGNTSYIYDGNGRLSQKTTGTDVTTYEYDSQGRLKQVQTPDHTIEYRHNALGNRVAKLKDGQVIERYLWQDKTTLLATYDGQGNLKQRFNYTLGHAPTSFTENGNTYYLLTDQLGSPRVITDSAGQVVKAIEYDAYGNVIHDSNSTITIPFGFAGGLKDDDTGLIRFGYRDYDPETGRWTARDPIGFAGGDTNLYGYVSNDPVNFVDPTGEIAWVVGAIAGAGADLAWQMIVEGKSWSCVDGGQVAAAAAAGAVGGGILDKIGKLNKLKKFDNVKNEGDQFTKEVVKRGKPGRDGGQSQHVIEKVNGQTTSTTHQVVKDGKLIHQHQDHVGKHGTIRRFSDKLSGTDTINAPAVKDTMSGGRLGFPSGS